MSVPGPQDMKGSHQQVGDGLSNLTGTVGHMIQDIGISSSNLQNTLNNVYDLYSRAISEREVLINDISKIVEGSGEATKKLAAAEAGKTAAEGLRSQAEEAKRLADEQHTGLRRQFEELQSSQQALKSQHQELTQSHSTLQGEHSALNQLHNEQLAVIRTHIGTITILKNELEKLEDNLRKLRSQSTAYDCIKLYEQVPLLIKLKRTFDASVRQVADPVTINSLKKLSSGFFQTEIPKLNQLVQNLKTIISSYTQANLQSQPNHWENSIDRIENLKKTISNNAFNTNLTFGDYVVFKWIVEKFPNVQVEQELKSKIDQITQQLRN
jgi:DNA repair exonuclease SbcCD ATPase subunit